MTTSLIMQQKNFKETYIKQLHLLLKSGTQDSQKDWFRVGDYKMLPNEVGGMETTVPENVHEKMAALLKDTIQRRKRSLMISLIFTSALSLFIYFRKGMAE